MCEEGFVSIYIPKRVVDEVLRKGLDVEFFVINSIIERLRLNPWDEIDVCTFLSLCSGRQEVKSVF